MSEVLLPGQSTSGDGFSVINESEGLILLDLPDFPGDTLGIIAGDEGGKITVDATIPVDFVGGEGADIYDASTVTDVVDGGAGNDTLFGGLGNDQLYGGLDNDVLLGEAGNDLLLGEEGNDRILGGAGNDNIVGGAGNDTMAGGAGNDLLRAGAGRDVMRGGSGEDTFRFNGNSAGPDGLDRVLDFNPGEDTIQVSLRLLPGSRLQAGQLRTGAFRVVDDLDDSVAAKIVYERSSGIVFYNPAGGGVEVPLFRLPAGLSDISASNFELF